MAKQVLSKLFILLSLFLLGPSWGFGGKQNSMTFSPRPFDPHIISEEGAAIFAQPTGTRYHLTRPLIYPALYGSGSKLLVQLAGVKRKIHYGREFLLDIGGVPFSIESVDGGKIDGIYLDPEAFKTHSATAFNKWKKKFGRHARFFGVNRDGEDLLSLMNIPASVKEMGPSGLKGVYFCQGSINCYEVTLQHPVMFLARGMKVAVFNYQGIGRSKGKTNWRETCYDSVAVTHFLRDQLQCSFSELGVIGYSLGSGPATFAAAECPGLHLMLDRGFSRMSRVAPKRFPALPGKKFQEQIIEQYYQYPNEDLIERVTGHIALLEAEQDTIMQGEAEILLQKIIHLRHQGDAITYEQLRDRYILSVSGTHFGPARETIPPWTADQKSQIKLNHFLEQIEPVDLP
ncbi:MAG: hypothetical protein S4CHLAM102_00090 [Chlamydiia bacterium]|nr:hypothetical protein [Chlamydiia bacterium]